MCPRLAASASAVALGLIGLAIAAARVGRFLLVAQGEEVLVPVGAALVGLGLGGIALTLASGRRRTALAALGIGVVGVAVGIGVRALGAVVSADPPAGVFVAHRAGDASFATPLIWSLVGEPALLVLALALVLLAVVDESWWAVRRLTRPRPSTSRTTPLHRQRPGWRGAGPSPLRRPPADRDRAVSDAGCRRITRLTRHRRLPRIRR